MKEHWKGVCSMPLIMKDEGYGRFKIFKTECSFPRRYGGDHHGYEYFEVRDREDHYKKLKSFKDLQEARDFASEKFKEHQDEIEGKSKI